MSLSQQPVSSPRSYKEWWVCVQVILRRKHVSGYKTHPGCAKVVKLNANFQQQTFIVIGEISSIARCVFLIVFLKFVCVLLRIPQVNRLMGIFPNLSNLSQVLSGISSKLHSSHSTISSYTLLSQNYYV